MFGQRKVLVSKTLWSAKIFVIRNFWSALNREKNSGQQKFLRYILSSWVIIKLHTKFQLASTDTSLRHILVRVLVVVVVLVLVTGEIKVNSSLSQALTRLEVDKNLNTDMKYRPYISNQRERIISSISSLSTEYR